MLGKMVYMIDTFKDQTIKQIGDIYNEVKRNTVLALHLKGLSLNEIVRRLGGTTKPVVKQILDELRKELNF